MAKAGDFIDAGETIASGASKAAGAADNLSGYQNKLLKGTNIADGVVGGVIAVGTTLDLIGNIMDAREARQMKKEQEDNLKKQEKEEAKTKRKRRRRRRGKRGLEDPEIVQYMYRNANNHTNYGASKLPGL